MGENRIIDIGLLGSDRKGAAQKLAAEKGFQYLDLDQEIEKEDGRSILRICMMMGEHEYRNKEYEMLVKLQGKENIVVSCGDAVMLDDMSLDILKKNRVILADWELTPEKLWERAKKEKGLPYAFMNEADEKIKKEKFITLYDQRRHLYEQFL